MVTGLAGALVYLACALFYQAGKRRTELTALKSSEKARAGVRTAGWAALLAALWLFALPQGWERGVAIWIGAITAAGGISLLVSALLPRWHLPSMAFAGACAVLLLLSLAVKGVAG